MENSSPLQKKKQWKIQMKYVDMGFDLGIWKIVVISVLLRVGGVMAVANVKAYSAESGKSTKKIRS